MDKISVVINTLNEEANLPKVIASAQKVASEIVVCDTGSTDNTLILAKKLGAKVVTFKGVGYVEPARNFAIQNAKGPWILVLDADEEVSDGLVNQIKKEIKSPRADYYRLPRKNIIFGKWMKHSRWWPDYNIRLFKKGKVSWNEVIHSVPMTVGKGFDLEENEKNAVIHNHYVSIDQYINRMNRYTSVQAEFKGKEGYKFNYLDLISKPANEFLSRFFAGRGYLDGVHGFGVSMLQAFSEVVLYLKLWQKSGFKETELKVNEIKNEVGKIRKDFNYWFSDVEVNKSKSLLAVIKRKLKLF